MKKTLLSVFLLILSFLVIPSGIADITITTEQHIYNLGNKIRASASVVQRDNFEGLFRLTLSCGNYKLQYFLIPISIEASFRTAINVPEVTVTPSMLGNCTIIGDLLTNDNLIIEEKESNSFGITNHLTILPINKKITALPIESIQTAGVINEAFGNNVLKASTKVALDNISHNIEALDGKFNFTLDIPRGIKSGRHTIEISASDSKGNSGASQIELEITAVPSYIKSVLSGNKFAPGSKIEILASLYDQADDLINASLDLELTSPNGNKIFRKVVQSNEKIDYEFSQYAEPGIYILISTYKNLVTQSSMNITTVREVKIRYENETVFVENIGNVPFEDELTFVLESKLKKYPIVKKIEVEPAKLLSIDLSKEVPLGIYDIALSVKEGVEPFKDSISGVIENIIEPRRLASNVTIHDNRPVYKKIGSGLASISGALVGADGVLAKNPISAPAILIIILLLIIIRYGRKPIMRLIRRKKDDDDKENED